MFRPLEVKPIQPKDGDKYKKPNGTIVIFNHGRWVTYVEKEVIIE